MSIHIPESFIRQYEAGVHIAFQREGSKLRGSVRVRNGVVGKSTTFQKVGKGTAGEKARHGLVPVMNLEFGSVDCPIKDYYAGEWSDALDELKNNIDERDVFAKSEAYALGRRADLMITDTLSQSNIVALTNAGGMTRDKALEAVEILNVNEVPNDGGRMAVVGAEQWTDLMSIPEFANEQWMGYDNMPWKEGPQVKRWLGMNWTMFTGLPLNGNVRTCFVYHRNCVGHAIQQDIKTDITWHGDRAAHFVASRMAMGACMIDETGVVKILCSQV